MQLKRMVWLIVGLLVLALVFGCSDDDPTGNGDIFAESTVGPTGGTVEVENKVSLEIPVGSLSDSVDFTISKNNSPASPGGTNDFVSSCYSIGPSGTTFSTPATITLNYNESDLGGTDESSIKIYTNSGSGWEELTTTVNASANTASTEVTHLSDFVTMVDTVLPAEGVYAKFSALRVFNYVEGSLWRNDFLYARFDSMYSPCIVVTPYQVDSVKVNEFKLEWKYLYDTTSQYSYLNTMNPAFLEIGQTLTFNVYSNDVVPSLTKSIDFPNCEPHFTNISSYDTLSLNGFSLEWEGTCSGNVQIVLVHAVDSLVSDETANDGSYTFTSSQLAGLSEDNYAIVMYFQNIETIDVSGYDSRSTITAGTMNMILIYLK